MSSVILAEHIAIISAGQTAKIPASVRKMLQRVTLDAYGLMLSARNTDYIQAIQSSCVDHGDTTAFGHGSRFTMQDAVLINGTAVHGEDFDDTFEGTPVHVSSVIIPTILAIAEREDLPPDKFIGAMAFGAELICRLALVAPTAIHRQGFHPTAILGAFGASLTASIAYGLSAQQTASALGIVGSMASGIIEYLAEGTWTKRMHPGWAAAAGIKSAVMAKAGFTGPRTVFEGTHGLFKGFAHDSIAPDFGHLESFGEEWISSGLAFKPYACGTMTQPFVDCAIQASKILSTGDIREIHAHVGEGTVHRLWEPLDEKRNPSTPYGAKFSVPYCIAIGFLDGKAGLNEFTEDQLSRDDIQSITSKTTYSINPEDPYPGEYVGWLDFVDLEGKTHTIKQACLRGGKQEPMTDPELEDKFKNNLMFAGLETTDIVSAQERINHLFNPKNNIRECVRALAMIGEKP